MPPPSIHPGARRTLYSTWTRTMASLIGMFAPGAAMGYIHRRNALATYAGASMAGPNKAWRPTNKSGDAIIKNDHVFLRGRARSLVRDSSHVSGALRKICNNVVFQGIGPQAQIYDGEKRDKTRNDLAEAAWRKWAQAVGFFEIERLVLRHWWQDGELFVHYYFDADLLADGIIPLGIQLLECDHLDTSYSGTDKAGRGVWKNGILISQNNRRVGYQLFTEHPGDYMPVTHGGSRFFSANDVDHLFVRDRISQNRGVPWLAPIIMEMRDFSEYQNAERIAARLAAAFGIFVKTSLPEHFTPGGYSPIGGDGKTKNAEDLPDYIDPGRIQTLPPGMEVQTASYNRPGDSYEPFTKVSLRGASTGFNMSYEAFSNDYTDASYASSRSATLEERRGYQVMQFLLTSMLHASAWNRMWRYNRLAATHRTLPESMPVAWMMPRWTWVDPDKDSKAAERDIKNGLASRHKLCRERGYDYDEIQADLAAEREDGFTGEDG